MVPVIHSKQIGSINEMYLLKAGSLVGTKTGGEGERAMLDLGQIEYLTQSP